ncbi:MAG: hypothetical protein IPH08_04150 [Rhodocyclaceae bacterium]|nr:hypothetical protein [Rhodocyclaceae bacterium]
MSWYIDGRGRRGHVATREYRTPRNIEPLRFFPGDLGHDARYRTFEASKENAIAELRLERQWCAYPLYPGERERWARAALDAAKLAGDSRADIAIMADILAQSAPITWQLVPSAPIEGERLTYAEGWTAG